MAQVYVSIGSNIERSKHIAQALVSLHERYGELKQSSVYESDAVGFDSARFYNLVVGFRAGESPHALQDHLHEMEAECGRVRTASLSARTLDLDLLLYDDLVVHEKGLVLPRDDITRYAFVLYPLAEILPYGRHPVSGLSYKDLWSAFEEKNGSSLRRIDWPARQ